MTDDRLFYAATERNREPILEVLRDQVPADARVLELASGSGEHAVHFATRLPGVSWVASDRDEGCRVSIAAWVEHEGLDNVAVATVDVEEQPWAVPTPIDVIFCANMIHIAPWSACLGMLKGAGELLAEGARLILYGPFMRDGRHTADSNARFDDSLRRRNPSWGVRDLAEVERNAEAAGLALDRVVQMPANNLTVVFRKR